MNIQTINKLFWQKKKFCQKKKQKYTARMIQNSTGKSENLELNLEFNLNL